MGMEQQSDSQHFFIEQLSIKAENINYYKINLRAEYTEK